MGGLVPSDLLSEVGCENGAVVVRIGPRGCPRPVSLIGRQAVSLRALIASGAAAALVLVMAGAATSSEPPPLPTTQTVRVRIEWADGDRKVFGDGRAVAIRGDSLLLDHLVVSHEGDATTYEVESPHVHLQNLEIQVSRGVRANSGPGALIGSVIGLALGALAYQSYTSDPLLSHPSNPNAGGLTVIGGGAFGALLGAGIGALIRTERWERVDRDRLQGLLENGPP